MQLQLEVIPDYLWKGGGDSRRLRVAQIVKGTPAVATSTDAPSLEFARLLGFDGVESFT